MRLPVLRCLLFVALLPLGIAPAQDPPKDDDEVKKLGPVDPYTEGDPASMAAAGVVGYGPFAWADFHSTTDVDRALGEGRVLWLETAHFKIGFNLRSTDWPKSNEARKLLQEELKQLRQVVPKVAAKPKRLDPWLLLHLYARRCENAYTEFLHLIGATDADFPARGKLPREGAFLGLPDKFLVLLFQKRSDMARYMDRFCGRKDDRSVRYYHLKSYQMLFCVAADALEGFDESGVHSHVLDGVWHNLMSGYQGYSFPLPLWFSEGLSHYFSRKVPTSALSVMVKDDEAVDQDQQNNWPVRVRRRAQHPEYCIPFETLAAISKWEDCGYHAHTQFWSRIDYLMQLDPEKVGLMLRQMKNVDSLNDWEGQGAQIRVMAQKLLVELFEMDAATFDERWRDWVLKTYPKK
ncbi:MAG TPA: hypothetical protein VFZ65_23495 [Planctomycetota bacterium]|nr:hypothetical protein [Planctomycetota bacterium]